MQLSLSDVNAKCSHLQSAKAFSPFLFQRRREQLRELESVHSLLLCDYVLELSFLLFYLLRQNSMDRTKENVTCEVSYLGKQPQKFFIKLQFVS